jgi:hypothetical protein
MPKIAALLRSLSLTVVCACPLLAGQLAVTQIPVGESSGARIVLIDTESSVTVRVLTEGFVSAGNPANSFDGQRLLFTGSRAVADAPAVWEIGVDGSGLRRVTDCPGGCARAIYLSSIYTLDAAAPEEQIAFVTLPAPDAPSTIYTCRPDGTHARPITFAPRGATDPALLGDGRLVFSMVAPPLNNTALFTINTDGTDVFPFAGLHGTAAERSTPCQVDDDTVVFAECDEAGCELVSVSRMRSLQSRRVIRSVAGERIRSLSPMPDGRLLMSHRKPKRGSTRLSILDGNSGTVIAKLRGDRGWHVHDAIWVGPHTKPPGRSSVVTDDDSVAELYCLDAYMSGQSVRSRETSAIDKIRILQGEHLLGEAQVEPDGSFFVEVPAKTPLHLASIGHDGTILDQMQSVFWVMPGERRGCIGCHEDREMTPPNRHVMALTKRAQTIGSAAP